MSSQYSLDPDSELTKANTAWQQAWDALVALAEALLTQNSNSIKRALDKAKDKQDQAQVALEDLEVAKKALKTPAEARGTLGDEDEKKLLTKADEVEQEAKRLEEEKEWTQKYQKWLRTGHGVALGLVALCGVLLSVEAIRTVLGMAKDNQLLLALGTVAVSWQVSAQALATSQRQLHATARQHRDTAEGLRDRARQVTTAKANAKAATDARGNIENAQVPLRKVTWCLEKLMAAVNMDRESKRQKFTEAEWVIEDILVDLRKASDGNKKMAQRLQKVYDELARQGGGTG
ncbi:hypothetical protein TURU_123062 [Turdus rufiventris]|nr:hypothetical protein TURU_123062 [Turdus rufiventris]